MSQPTKDAPAFDPLEGLIADLLTHEGLHQDTALLIRLALDAQKTGAMPDLQEITKQNGL